MKPFSRSSLLLLLMLSSSMAFAVCDDGNGRLRGEYHLRVGHNDKTLIKVKQNEEALRLQFSSQERTFWIDHPGGAGLDHLVLLESGEGTENFEVCLFSAYSSSQPGSYSVEETRTESFTAEEIKFLRELSHAATVYAANNYQSRTEALTLYRALSEPAVPSVRSELSVQAHLFAALIYSENTDYQQALDVLNKLGELVPTDSLLYYKLAYAKGEVYLRLRQLSLATEQFRQAIEIIETRLQGNAGPANRDLTDIRLLLAEALLTQGDSEAAIEQIELAASTAGTEYRLLARLQDIMGYYLINRSEQPGLEMQQRRDLLSESVDTMLAGKHLAENAGDNSTLLAIENNLGFVYNRLGEYRRSITHYRNILNLTDPQEDPLGYRFVYTNLGRAYQQLADYPRSESYYRQAINLAETSTGVTSVVRCSLGTTLRLNGEFQNALKEHELCLQQAEASNSYSTAVLARYELGEDALALGDVDSAWDHLSWAKNQDPERISSVIRTRVLRSYALIAQRRGESDEASLAIADALSLHQNNLDRIDVTDQVENFAAAMQIAALQGNTNRAETFGLEALQLIEALYGQLESERQGPAWSSRTHEIYVQLAELYLQSYFKNDEQAYLYKAFEIVERSRAISLRQHLVHNKTNSAGTEQTLRSTQQIAEQAQIEAISRIANKHALIQPGDKSEIKLPANYYHHQDVLSLYRLGSLESFSLPPAMSLADIQMQLKSDQMVLYYLQGKNLQYVFTLTSENLAIHKVEGETGSLVSAVYESLPNANTSPYATMLQLSEHLLGPLQGNQNKKHLLIVPHDSLYALPFAALPLPGRAGYEPLGSRYTVQIVPSMTTYLMEKPLNNRRGQPEIAVFADPVFDAGTLESQLAMIEAEDKQDLRNWSDNLKRLPYTAIEARNLARLFPEDRSILLTGERASRSNLARDDVRNARVLHIATHGYFNAANDDNVGLGFSVIDENGKPDTGFVTLPELFSYRFNNELVVISGCDTAMGRPLAGEGMMGLTRGFIAQGAKHVISTLWPVSDRASADFMARFYQRLVELDDVALALQAAQNDIRQIPDYRHPFYWAAYQLTSVSLNSSIVFNDQSISN